MRKGESRKQQLLESMADHLLTNGLEGASLRSLAAAAGTSDRMLLHYFADKEALLTATLTRITQRLVAVLASAQAEQMPFQSLVVYLASMMKAPAIQPYMRLWLELATLAARNQEPFCSVAKDILTTFSVWIGSALRVEKEEDREALAALTLAIIEGFNIFDAVGDDTKQTRALAGLALL